MYVEDGEFVVDVDVWVVGVVVVYVVEVCG